MAEIQKSGKGEQFSGRWGLVFAAMGMAIGTGNIWRFPRVVASNGGGVFIVALIAALFLWAIPLLCAEGAFAKRARMSHMGSFKNLVGKKYTWLGGVVWIVCMAIAFYYVVVLGWCIRYFVYAITGQIVPGVDTEAMWNAYLGNPVQSLVFFVIAVGFSVGIVSFGVTKGIERANKIMIPAVFLLLVFMSIRAVTLPNAWRGLEYMFTCRPEDWFNAKVYLEAFTQAAWSTGAGWGLYHTLCIYARKDEDILLNSCTTAFADTAAAMLSGITVLCTVFALSPDPMAVVASGNNGLAFIHMTNLFTQIAGGTVFASAFFLALIFAAASSEITMIETGVRAFQDAGWTRNKALAMMTVCTLIVGSVSAVNNNFFENQDFVWGVGLLLSGLCYSIGAIKAGVNKLWDEVIDPASDIHFKWMWSLIRFFPVWFVILFGWWIWQAASWYPGEWFKFWPVTKYMYTPGVMMFEWGIMIVVLLALNNRIADAMKFKHEL